MARCPLVKQYGIATYLEFTRRDHDWLYRPTELGLEFQYDMTIWTWIRFHPESDALIINFFGKWASDNDRSYLLLKGNDEKLEFAITEDGHNITRIKDDGSNHVNGKWIFVAGRFTANTEMALFVGEATGGKFNWYRNVVAIPSSIWISVCDLTVGQADDGWVYVPTGQYEYFLDGDKTLFGLANRALTDIYIQNLFSQSRPLLV